MFCEQASHMRNQNFRRSIPGVSLALLLAVSASHAQMYRWVDANGQTHYSQSKEAAGNAKAEELKLQSDSISAEEANASAQYWQEQNKKIDQRQMQAQKARADVTPAPPMPTRPRSLSGGRSDGSDAQRCALARDVLSGAVRHRNGAPTDKYDREVAENDVRAACR
jgi:hypothetical protein